MVEQFSIKRECALCPTNIWGIEKARLKKTNEYNEVNLVLNDLSHMRVGVCSKHTEPEEQDLSLITKKIHQGWLEEVALGIGNERWVKEKGLKLEITDVAV